MLFDVFGSSSNFFMIDFSLVFIGFYVLLVFSRSDFDGVSMTSEAVELD